MQNTLLKIVKKSDASHCKSRNLKTIELNKTTIKNALSMNKSMSMSEKFNILRSYDTLTTKNDQGLADMKEEINKKLDYQGFFRNFSKMAKKNRKAKKITILPKQTNQNGEYSISVLKPKAKVSPVKNLRTRQASKQNMHDSMKLDNVRDLLFPSVHSRSRASVNLNKSFNGDANMDTKVCGERPVSANLSKSFMLPQSEDSTPKVANWSIKDALKGSSEGSLVSNLTKIRARQTQTRNTFKKIVCLNKKGSLNKPRMALALTKKAKSGSDVKDMSVLKSLCSSQHKLPPLNNASKVDSWESISSESD